MKKVNNTDTSGFVLKTKHDTDKWDLETKVSDTSGLVKKTDLIGKITEIENKIPSGFTTNATSTAVKNKIPDVSNLVKKPDYNAKISEIEKQIADHNHDKYITTPEFNKLTAQTFAARLAQANLLTKDRFSW